MSEDSLDLYMGLDEWTLGLIGGGEIRIRALGYSREGDYLVFSGLERGEPNKNVDLVWVPAAIVEQVRGANPAETSRQPN